MSRRNYGDKEAPYEFYNVPDCKEDLEDSVLLKISDRKQMFPCVAEMLELCTEASRRRKLRWSPRARNFQKPLSVHYIADRLDTDDPIEGYMVRTKKTGWLQGFIVTTTFTTWQRWFRFDSESPHGQLDGTPEGRKCDWDGSLARELERQKRAGSPDGQGVVWSRVGEVSLLGALRCGRWLVKLVIEELEARGDYDCLVLQATDESIPFYESLGFIRVGALAKYVKKGADPNKAKIVPYRHWTYADQLISKMPGPSYMMARRLDKCKLKTRGGKTKRLDLSRYLATKPPKIKRTARLPRGPNGVRVPGPDSWQPSPRSKARALAMRKARREENRRKKEALRKASRRLLPGQVLVHILCKGLEGWLSIQDPLSYFDKPWENGPTAAPGPHRLITQPKPRPPPRKRIFTDEGSPKKKRTLSDMEWWEECAKISAQSPAKSKSRQKQERVNSGTKKGRKSSARDKKKVKKKKQPKKSKKKEKNKTKPAGRKGKKKVAAKQQRRTDAAKPQIQCSRDPRCERPDRHGGWCRIPEPGKKFRNRNVCPRKGKRTSSIVVDSTGSSNSSGEDSESDYFSAVSSPESDDSNDDSSDSNNEPPRKRARSMSMSSSVAANRSKKRRRLSSSSSTGSQSRAVLKKRQEEQLRLLNQVVKVDPKAVFGSPLRNTRRRTKGKAIHWKVQRNVKRPDSTRAAYYFVARYDLACKPPHCHLLPLAKAGVFDKRGPRAGRVRWKLKDGEGVGVEGRFCKVAKATIVSGRNSLDTAKFTWDIRKQAPRK
jgi:hypothetical protein